MNQKELEAFAKEAAKNIKTGADLDKFRAMLTKVTVEAALNAELDEHLGYSKHDWGASSSARPRTISKSFSSDLAFWLPEAVRTKIRLRNFLAGGPSEQKLKNTMSGGNFKLVKDCLILGGGKGQM